MLFAGGVALAEEPVELPVIEITTASPVVNPQKKTKPKPAPRAAQVSADVHSQPGPLPFREVLDLDLPAGTSIVAADTFVPVTVATEREFLSNYGATITDTLQNKPGIAGSTFAPGANRPIIRGLDSYRIRIQEDGIGTHDVSAISEDHAIPIDPSDASRVEVVRGPATLRYGSEAIGGVVSVENQRIPTYMPTNGFSGQIKGGANSVDDGEDGAITGERRYRPCRRVPPQCRRLRYAARRRAEFLRREPGRRGRALLCLARGLHRGLACALREFLRHPRRGGGRGRAAAHRPASGQGHGQRRVASQPGWDRSGAAVVRGLRLCP